MNVSWIDVKLGLRMLKRYPWLSGVAVLGMALAIAIGAAYVSIINLALDATLPVAGGERLIAIQTTTVAGPDTGRRQGVLPQDFVQWRTELRSIGELGASRDEARNLTIADGPTDVVRVAAITASAFRLMHATPLLGRTLLDHDERPDAPPVAVIGYDAWRRQFNGDERVIGTSVRLDGAMHTVVGVMPEDFRFPIRHQYWVPLRLPGAGTTVDDDARLLVFGRVADGLSLTEARSELSAVGDRMARALPNTHKNVRPLALRYTQTFTGIAAPREQLALRAFQLGAAVLLLIVAVNVAVLVYARTATRTGEIVVRTALGASRGRVVSQLLVEALVLTAGAAALGLTIVAVMFGLIRAWMKDAPHLASIPYWFEPALSWSAVLYVVLLAIVAAVVIGVLPAMKATGGAVQARLQQFSGRGAGMQLGRLWTVSIVAQVAIAVAILPTAMHNGHEALGLAMDSPAPAANEMLRGTLEMRPDTSTVQTVEPRGNHLLRLIQRLETEPEVAAATFAQGFPGREPYVWIEVERVGQRLASSTWVATNLFEVFDVPILAGRPFGAADAAPSATSVIVDQTFVDGLGPDGNLVGRRIRYVRHGNDGSVEFGPWLDIVGVVPAFANSFSALPPFTPPPPRFYHADAPADANSMTLVVRVKGGDPTRFAPRLREMAAAVDPSLKLQALTGVVDAWRYDRRASSVVAFVIVAVTGSVLLLSAAGIYAMTSFTVTSRRREIGIRAALGANPRRLLAGIFGRASAHLGAGVMVGLLLATALEWMSGGTLMDGNALVLLPVVVALMFIVGLLAALGPARRGLAVQPTEALRAE